ncbi:flagellar hook-length control protein FliK [Konateibacter massiliensis]|uniref:flagellar hook-length control protein FliK n=1 Tax=Konateibacter massiliensis TaxID=2002841 RepID=UPI000C154105|nr:flagellar hook-length control protein FliK [Konateibacter massiliensis]
MEIGYSNISSNNKSAGMAQSLDAQNARASTQSDLSGFAAGKVFRGEILEVKGSQVSIGLENGQVLNARLESGINLTVGQKVDFEVEANSGSRIEIRPVADTQNPNPVLQKALQAANLPITDKNLSLVNAMLKEGLSIDKKSITDMMKQINMHPETDTDVIVKMNKLGIEVTKENIQQFENYKNYEHRIVKEVGNVANSLAELLKEVQGENKSLAIQLNNRLIEILGSQPNNVESQKADQGYALDGRAVAEAAKTGTMPGNIPNIEAGVGGASVENKSGLMAGASGMAEAAGVNVKVDAGASSASNMSAATGINGETNVSAAGISGSSNAEAAGITMPNETAAGITGIINSNETAAVINGSANPNEMAAGTAATSNSTEALNTASQNAEAAKAGQLPENLQTGQEKLLQATLNGRELASLAENLKELGAKETLLIQVKDGTITSRELLNQVKLLLENGNHSEKADVLFNSKEYMEVLKQSIKEQWLVKPENLNEPDKMSKLYKGMEEQTRQLSTLLETIGKENSSLMRDVSNMRSNLNFMEQVNQNFTYLQIPVKFSNEEAHSDLYVYTNKKSLKEHDGNLSVLLHLDMEVLGMTDIYLTMSGNQVNAKFSLKNKESIELVDNNLESLIEQLREKGYQATATAEAMEKEPDFVDDFLEKDKTITSLKRYAFDVRT